MLHLESALLGPVLRDTPHTPQPVGKKAGCEQNQQQYSLDASGFWDKSGHPFVKLKSEVDFHAKPGHPLVGWFSLKGNPSPKNSKGAWLQPRHGLVWLQVGKAQATNP